MIYALRTYASLSMKSSVPVFKAMFLALCVAFLFCLWSEHGIRLKTLHLTHMSTALRNVYLNMAVTPASAPAEVEDLNLLETKMDMFFYSAAVSIPDKSKVCNVNLVDNRLHLSASETGVTIYFVTPTYPRPEQIPELTRLSHTLMHVPKLHWIVADDQPGCSNEVLSVIRKSGLPFTHLASPKPHKFKGKIVPRGVSNRRAALTWLRSHVSTGVLYFGDDDNTVDLQLFDEIRRTKKVSMFPVGLIGGYGVSSPVVRDGKVIAFYDSWPGSRTFPVDMAGFAVNLEHLRPSANMPYIAGHEEDRFLVSLGLQLHEIEPLAHNCSKVLVWHTRTAKYQKPTIKMTIEKINELQQYPDFGDLLQETARMGMASLDSKKGVKPLVIRDKNTYESLNML